MAFRTSVFLGAAGLLLSSALVPAHAQAPQASPADGPAVGIQDIVVTAQRREERNQAVPISITAFSPDRLKRDNVTQMQDLGGLVPSLVVGSNGQGSRDTQSPTIRGQGATFQASPAVVVYMNEVPLPAASTLSQQGGAGNFIDLENVQVLAGPQGTLFGRNTTGGAVLLVPKKPVDRFEGYIEGGLGTHALNQLEGMLNVPLIDDRLMVRVVGAYRDRDGFTKDLVWNKKRDDTHWYAGRVGILAKPVDGLTNYLMVYGSKSDTNGVGLVHTGFNIEGLKGYGLCQEGPSVPFAVASCDVYRHQTELAAEIGPRQTRLGVDEFQYVHTWGLTNTTDLELGDELTLRNIFSFQRFKGSYSYDQDATPLQQNDQNVTRYPDFPVPGLAEFGLPPVGYLNGIRNDLPRDNLKQITEELQIQGDMLDNQLTFTAGAFLFDQKPVGVWDGPQMIFCPAAFTGMPIPGTTACSPQHVRTTISTNSKALYAQATLDLGVMSDSLAGLRVTGGYRYTWDEVRGYAALYTPIADSGDVACGSSPDVVSAADFEHCAFEATLKSSAPSWTFGIDYTPIDNLLLYARSAAAIRRAASTAMPSGQARRPLNLNA